MRVVESEWRSLRGENFRLERRAEAREEKKIFQFQSSKDRPRNLRSLPLSDSLSLRATGVLNLPVITSSREAFPTRAFFSAFLMLLGLMEIGRGFVHAMYRPCAYMSFSKSVKGTICILRGVGDDEVYRMCLRFPRRCVILVSLFIDSLLLSW